MCPAHVTHHAHTNHVHCVYATRTYHAPRTCNACAPYVPCIYCAPLTHSTHVLCALCAMRIPRATHMICARYVSYTSHHARAPYVRSICHAHTTRYSHATVACTLLTVGRSRPRAATARAWAPLRSGNPYEASPSITRQGETADETGQEKERKIVKGLASNGPKGTVTYIDRHCVVMIHLATHKHVLKHLCHVTQNLL